MTAERHEPFPGFIRALPMVDSPLASLRGWLLGTDQALAMFYEIPDGVDLPEHAHGAQWGVVIAGAIDFTIDGETRTYRAGDTYFVPDGAAHSAFIHPGYDGVDVVADADRYRTRGRAGTGQDLLESSAAEG